jgi:hypothetical protein
MNEIAEIDYIFLHCMQMAFDWANQKGLKGQKVFALHLVEPDKNSLVRQPHRISCMIECTKEEREAWEKSQEENIIHAVKQAITEEE